MKKNHWRTDCKNHSLPIELKQHPQYEASSEDLFRLHVPLFFKNKINLQQQNDPLLLQVLPHKKELIPHKNYQSDPVGDLNARQNKGIIHKYHKRVLLIATGACAINCRYCFRREFPYQQNNAAANNWSNAIKYLAADKQIEEVILSGGDPLMLTTEKLASLTQQLEKLSHIKTLRIHTRIPIVAPSRINPHFIQWLDNIKLNKVMVVHCNHANELDNKHQQLFTAIKNSNTLLLNQSVLLKNINDNPQTLIQLSYRLLDFSILPYYLHQLDKVTGTKHFRVKNKKAKKIHKTLRHKLPGYLVPKLVTEIAGKKAKTPLF